LPRRTFQRCVIGYQAVLAFVCLVVILPIHLFGGHRFERHEFGATTLPNILTETSHSHEEFTYVHVIGSFLLLPWTLFVMRVFFRRIGNLRGGQEFEERRTLYLTGLPERLRNKDAIQKYMWRRYPGCRIESIRVNIKLVSISHLEEKYNELQEILSESEKSGDNERLFPKCLMCAWLVQVGTRPRRVLDYYAEEKRSVEKTIQEEAHKITLQHNKLDSAFVRMELLEDAIQIGNCPLDGKDILFSSLLQICFQVQIIFWLRFSPQVHSGTEGLHH